MRGWGRKKKAVKNKREVQARKKPLMMGLRF